MPSLSAEAIRQNGGTPPPREPLLPSRCTIQLYNPDQQIILQYKPKTWNAPPMWTFEMPMHSFRQPSSSRLDRTQSDPAAVEFTPKLKFTWRRDGKLSKDLTCLLNGVTNVMPEPKNKRKEARKEADIPIAMFQAHREVTLYEPNLYRVEMEDFKGLELVLILSAILIRDVYSGPLKDAFNISEVAPGPVLTRPQTTLPVITRRPSPLDGRYPAASSGAQRPPNNVRPSSPTDVRLRQEVEAERTRLRIERERQDQEENRRTREFLEEEERIRRRRQTEVDRETERLQRVYGEEERIALAQTTTPAHNSASHQRANSPARAQMRPQAYRPAATNNWRPYYSMYQPYGRAPTLDPRSPYQSTSQLLQTPYYSSPQSQNGHQGSNGSFLGFRGSPGVGNRISKKRSSVF